MISWARCVLGQSQEVEQIPDDPAQLFEPPAETKPADAAPRAPAWGTRVLPMGSLALGIVVVAFLVYRSMEQARFLEGELEYAQTRITGLLTENRRMTRELSQLRIDRDTLDARVAALQDELSMTTGTMEGLRVALRDAQAQMHEVQDQRASLEQELLQARQGHEAAAQQVVRLEDQQGQLRGAVSRLREQLAFLERDYQRVSSHLAAAPATRAPQRSAAAPPAPLPGLDAVQLEPILVQAAGSQPPASLRGRVVEVNPVHKFAVLDKGRVDGVREGMVFDIIRDGRPVGQVRVADVRGRLAAADWLGSDRRASIRPGDVAIQRLATASE